MKFFDLEMDSCLAKGLNKKTGGKNAIFTGQATEAFCQFEIYHGGTNFQSCAESRFTSSKTCDKTTVVEY